MHTYIATYQRASFTNYGEDQIGEIEYDERIIKALDEIDAEWWAVTDPVFQGWQLTGLIPVYYPVYAADAEF